MRVARFIASAALLALLPLLHPAAAGAHPLDQWHVRTNLSFNAVTHGNGKFVAVGASGRVATATHGRTWTVSYPTNTPLSGVAFGNGVFVAVGINNVILTSPDAVTWTPRPSGTNVTFSRISFGNSRFVALAYSISPMNELSLVSSNGVDWSCHYLSSAKAVARLTFGHGLFVHNLSSTNLLSADGIQWWPQGSCLSNSLYLVQYAGDRFVAVDTRNQTFASTDATNWSPVGIIPTLRPQDIAFGNGLWVAVSLGDSPAWSGDLAHWAEGPVAYAQSCVCFGNGTFVGAYNSLYQSDPVVTLQPVAPNAFYLSGPTGAVYRIESVDGLIPGGEWQPETNFTLQTSPALWTDPAPPRRPQRFYRAFLTQ